MTIEAPRCSGSTIVVADVVNYLEQIIPLHSQSTLPKSGLIVGDMDSIVTGILICLDIIEAVLDEAIEKNCNLLIVNQPLYRQPFIQITPGSYVGKCIIKAIRYGLSVYVFNTNLDHLGNGSSHRIANLMELQEMQPIVPKKEVLHKLTTFVPPHAQAHVIETLYRVGAMLATHHPVGYENASTRLETSQESQLTFIVPPHFKEKIIQALWHVHPYEKVAYYLEQVEVVEKNVGSGVMGILPIALPAKYFLKYAKTKLALSHLQHASYAEQTINKVAIYAGDGGWLLEEVLHKQVDAFITTGLQYEQFLTVNEKMLMIDIGYGASRLGVRKLILAELSKEFNNIAIVRCTTVTNPVHYIKD